MRISECEMKRRNEGARSGGRRAKSVERKAWSEGGRRGARGELGNYESDVMGQQASL